MLSHTITKKELRKFGVIMGSMIPLLIGWLIPAIQGESFRPWTLWFGSLSLILGLTAPQTLVYPYKGLAKGTIIALRVIGNLVTFLLISILQPTAIMMGLMGYDPLQKRQSNLNSYREIGKRKTCNLKDLY